MLRVMPKIWKKTTEKRLCWELLINIHKLRMNSMPKTQQQLLDFKSFNIFESKNGINIMYREKNQKSMDFENEIWTKSSKIKTESSGTVLTWLWWQRYRLQCKWLLKRHFKRACIALDWLKRNQSLSIQVCHGTSFVELLKTRVLQAKSSLFIRAALQLLLPSIKRSLTFRFTKASLSITVGFRVKRTFEIHGSFNALIDPPMVHLMLAITTGT